MPNSPQRRSQGTTASFGYTRNDNGNLATATTTGITQPAETYGYTSRDEFASINTSTYGYDTAGNPLSLTNVGTMTYDAANQPTWRDNYDYHP